MKLLNKRILLKAVKEENPLNPDTTGDFEVMYVAEGVELVKEGDRVKFFQASSITIEGQDYRLCEEDDLVCIL